MTTALKSLLDDAASEATRDLRVDLAAARARAGERRRAVRRRAAAVMTTAVAVAATIVLAVVLLPGAFPRADAVQPAANTPTGLPDRWFASPTWLPPVTRKHMPAASMVLNTSVSVGGLDWASVPGPVLVSADGRQYAGLPWTRDDKLVALSADGRRVGWVTQAGHQKPVVHRVELATGERRDDRLATTDTVSQLVWAGDTLWAGVGYHADAQPSTWSLRPGAGAVKVCRCGSEPLADTAQGELRQPPPSSPGAGQIPGVPMLTALRPLKFPMATTQAQEVVSDQVALSPDGKRAATVSMNPQGSGWELQLEDGNDSLLLPLDGVMVAKVMAWTPAGVLLSLATNERSGPVRSVRLYSENGGLSRPISRPYLTVSELGAVAPAVLGAGPAVVPAVTPEFSTSDRGHLRWQFAHGWSAFGGDIEKAAVLLVVLLVALGAWRRTRRRKSEAGDEGDVMDSDRDESAQSSGGAGQAGDGG